MKKLSRIAKYSPRLTHGAILAMAALAFDLPAIATPPYGQTAQAFRGKLVANINTNQWGVHPLFNLQAMSSSDAWGYDVVQADAAFAPVDSSSKPGTSGWHSHPVALALVQVIQGTIWEQNKDRLDCLTPYPAGSVLVEHTGGVHNIFNIDTHVSAVVRIIYIVERYITVTRTDEPDPMTGSLGTATPPPAAVCSR
jgi:hypothetical protein